MCHINFFLPKLILSYILRDGHSGLYRFLSDMLQAGHVFWVLKTFLVYAANLFRMPVSHLENKNSSLGSGFHYQEQYHKINSKREILISMGCLQILSLVHTVRMSRSSNILFVPQLSLCFTIPIHVVHKECPGF